MTWQGQLHGDPLPWPLAPDDPGVRYMALCDLLDRPAADPESQAARRLAHALAPGGQFSTSSAPSGTIDCLQGNLGWALLALGCEDPRLDQAFEWRARTVTGEGMAPSSERNAPIRYYAHKCGPNFACGAGGRGRRRGAWAGVDEIVA